jgi:serine/threonine protein kinase
MALAPGEKLQHFEILALIGKGGMGEVYKARDTRLQREVAIKISEERFSERFEREARVVASLNHPNICALFDIGPNYLVMEYIEGESPKGPLPVETVLDYAKQMAEALDAAHEKGITHRDLKPGNLKITPEGKLKVLDFGLAKVDSASRPDVSNENSPTLTIGMTEAGMILGTAAYMAPEQAKGRAVDKRADIWAFGVVLYELSTGKRLFKGDDVSDTLASVLKDQPDFDSVPARLRPLLARCLEKDPKKRLRDIGDALSSLEDSAGAAARSTPLLRKTGRVWPWIAAAIATVAAVAFATLYYTRPSPEPHDLVRFTISAPPGYILNTTRGGSPQYAASPDGRYIAFVANLASSADAPNTVWIRPIGSLAAQRLENTEGANFPFWSPDSKNVAFFAGGKLMRIPVAGGSPITICQAEDGEGGTWFKRGNSTDPSDEMILFAPGPRSGIQRVAATGGVPVFVTKLEKGESGHIFPQFLPDGKRFLYFARGSKPGIYVRSLDSDTITFLIGASNRALIAPPDFLLYLQDSTLLAQRWDWNTLKPASEAIQIVDEVRTGDGANGRNAFTVSANGLLAYRTGSLEKAQYRWYTRDGKLTGAAFELGSFREIAVSPDNKYAVLVKETSTDTDLWLGDLASGVLQRLTLSPDRDTQPVWSPDSHRVAFTRLTGSKQGIYQTVIGSGKETLLYPDIRLLEAWTRDALVVRFQDTNTVALVPAPPEDAVGPLTEKPKTLWEAKGIVDEFRVSPDGKWVAYMTQEGGMPEVWVAAFPSFMNQRKVSTRSGVAPLWRADGRELVYCGEGGVLYSVDVQTGATFEAGTPKILKNLSPTSYVFSSTIHFYAMTSDGQRFLVHDIPGLEQQDADPLFVMMNWPSLLGK